MLLRRPGLVVMLALGLALGVLAGSAPGLAHQQKIAISTILLNPRSGMIEIVHQVPVHDAEHALSAQGFRGADIIGSPASREAFAAYVAGRFLLEVGGTPVEPVYVGSEIGGGSLWVYREVPAPAGGAGAALRFTSQIFTDVWAQQENRVNIGGGTSPDTFIFRAGDPPREALLR